MLLTIVGAGPVGLVAGIIFKRVFPKLNVQIIEKRKAKTRDQIVYFKPYTLKRTLPESIIKKLTKEGEGCYMLPPDRDQTAYCYKEQPVEGHYSLAISISRLQDVLEGYAKQLKVKLINKEVLSAKDVKGDIIIGADGIHSVVRRTLLKTEFKRFDEYESYGLAVTYKDDSNPKFIIGVNSDIAEKISLAKVDQHRKRFFRTNGESYLGLQISKVDYESLIKSDTIDYKDAPKHIKELIVSYLRHIKSDTKGLKSAQLSVFPIDIKRAVRYAQLVNNTELVDGTPVFLLGDAAISSHFFSAFGINVGIEEARYLLQLVYKYDLITEDKLITKAKTKTKSKSKTNTNREESWEKVIKLFEKQMDLFSTDALNEAINVYLPIEQVDQICSGITKEELNKVAKQEGVNIKGLSKQEGCYLLSRYLLLNYSDMFFRN